MVSAHKPSNLASLSWRGGSEHFGSLGFQGERRGGSVVPYRVLEEDYSKLTANEGYHLNTTVPYMGNRVNFIVTKTKILWTSPFPLQGINYYCSSLVLQRWPRQVSLKAEFFFSQMPTVKYVQYLSRKLTDMLTQKANNLCVTQDINFAEFTRQVTESTLATQIHKPSGTVAAN